MDAIDLDKLAIGTARDLDSMLDGETSVAVVIYSRGRLAIGCATLEEFKHIISTCVHGLLTDAIVKADDDTETPAAPAPKAS